MFKKIWNTPITWGSYTKFCAAWGLFSIAVSGGIMSYTSYKLKKENDEFIKSLNTDTCDCEEENI